MGTFYQRSGSQELHHFVHGILLLRAFLFVIRICQESLRRSSLGIDERRQRRKCLSTVLPEIIAIKKVVSLLKKSQSPFELLDRLSRGVQEETRLS
jgi:hypothetical protein